MGNLMPCACGETPEVRSAGDTYWAQCPCGVEGEGTYGSEEARIRWNMDRLAAENAALREGRAELTTERDAALEWAERYEQVVVERDRLREAVLPFSIVANLIDRYRPDAPDDGPFKSGCAWTEPDGRTRPLTYGDFRAARAALSKGEG